MPRPGVDNQTLSTVPQRPNFYPQNGQQGFDMAKVDHWALLVQCSGRENELPNLLSRELAEDENTTIARKEGRLHPSERGQEESTAVTPRLQNVSPRLFQQMQEA